jgi:hypothetical protein
LFVFFADAGGRRRRASNGSTTYDLFAALVAFAIRIALTGLGLTFFLFGDTSGCGGGATDGCARGELFAFFVAAAIRIALTRRGRGFALTASLGRACAILKLKAALLSLCAISIALTGDRVFFVVCWCTAGAQDRTTHHEKKEHHTIDE